MIDTKEYILTKAFEVFLTKGYDSTSMTVLQNEFKMSRGAMYRYYKSKEELFQAVIDRYFFGAFEYIRPRMKEGMTVAERIDSYYEGIERVCKKLDGIEGLEIIFLNYTGLIIQAAKHYPGFVDRHKARLASDFRDWQIAIENSIEKGEIRADVDIKIMAQIFMKSINVNDMDTNVKSFTRASKLTRKMMNYIYSLIKT